MLDPSFWKRDYRLDRMSLGELWVAYLLHPAIQVYIVLAGGGAYLAWRWAESLAPVAFAGLAAVLVYPVVWYLLHRFVLHGSFLYRSPWTARVWKRIHFDHHRDPDDLRVLFGALYTTLPTIVFTVAPIGALIGGRAGAAAATAAALVVTCVYEFCHCVQHLRFVPKWNFLRRIKRLHLQHHFHDETVNYGIISFLPDKMFGTFRDQPAGKARSATVFNLGYTGEAVRRFPWVARHTADLDEKTAARQEVRRRHPKAM